MDTDKEETIYEKIFLDKFWPKFAPTFYKIQLQVLNWSLDTQIKCCPLVDSLPHFGLLSGGTRGTEPYNRWGVRDVASDAGVDPRQLPNNSFLVSLCPGGWRKGEVDRFFCVLIQG